MVYGDSIISRVDLQSDADQLSDEEKQRIKDEAKKLRLQVLLHRHTGHSIVTTLQGQNPDGAPDGDFMSEAKDWAGELISGQTGTGRILVGWEP